MVRVVHGHLVGNQVPFLVASFACAKLVRAALIYGESAAFSAASRRIGIRLAVPDQVDSFLACVGMATCVPLRHLGRSAFTLHWTSEGSLGFKIVNFIRLAVRAHVIAALS